MGDSQAQQSGKYMSRKAKRFYATIRLLRTCFNRLKSVADEMHRDLGVSASMRAVMEALADEGQKSVPEIARSRGVSRQHIQVNVDALSRKGMVEQRENPRHKRSPLIALTTKGSETFEEIRHREVEVIESLARGISAEMVDAAFTALTVLNEGLAQLETRGDEDD